MAKPTEPVEHLNIKGTEYTLEFDMDGIAEAEEVTGHSLLTSLSRVDVETPKISFIRGMLYGCLRKHHPDIAYADSQKLVTLKNHADVWAHVIKAFVAVMAEPEDGDTPGEATDQS